jgi:predicted metal-dependent phosphoesterase TrpH
MKIKADSGGHTCYNNRMKITIRIELHCHTSHSGDGLISPQKLLDICDRKGIERIVVTDHNITSGAQAAYALNPERVIVGEEIMTTGGELLAAFVQEEVPPGLPPIETIRILREQGAFISVSHPFDTYRKGHWKTQTLLEISPLVDAIEVFNARCMRSSDNDRALEFARQHGLLGTVGSDAHAPFEVGRATMLLPDFEDAAGLKESLVQARQDVQLSGAWVHLFSRYAKWSKRLAKNAR